MFPATEHGYDKRLWPPSNAFSHGLQVTTLVLSQKKRHLLIWSLSLDYLITAFVGIYAFEKYLRNGRESKVTKLCH